MGVIFEFANFSSDFLQFSQCIKSTDWDFLINWGSCICCSVPAYRLLLWSMLHFSKNISSWNEAWFFRILCIFFFLGFYWFEFLILLVISGKQQWLFWVFSFVIFFVDQLFDAEILWLLNSFSHRKQPDSSVGFGLVMITLF